MIGHIRTEEKCPNCGAYFTYISIPTPTPTYELSCVNCKTHPDKFYLDIHLQGKRYRIFRDELGNRLKSYPVAYKLLIKINREIKQKVFNLNRYLSTDKARAMAKVRAEAEAKAIAEAEADLARYQFDHYVEMWFDLTNSNRTKGTRRSLWYRIRNHCLPFFRDRDIRTIKTVDIARFVSSLSQSGLSTTYQVTIVTYLKAIFRKAYDWEDISRIPVFPKIKAEPATFKWIDRDTQLRLLGYVNPHHHPILKFLFLTGCRIAEGTALKWDCIDQERRAVIIKRTHSLGELHETTKTGKLRALYMTDQLQELLSAQWPLSGSEEIQLKSGGYVFLTLRSKPYSSGNLTHEWRKACGKAGIKISLYNATRHSFASQRVNAGFSLEEIGAVLGHSSLEMTKRYARILTENLKEVMEGKAKYGW